MSSKFKLSEDWLSTIIGLVLVLIVGSGIIGPGPQKVTLTASAGESAEEEARAIDSWSISGTINGETATVEALPQQLEGSETVTITCSNGTLTQETASNEAGNPSSDHALLVLQNNCDAEVTLTYSTDYFVRWPLFGLFE